MAKKTPKQIVPEMITGSVEGLDARFGKDTRVKHKYL